MTRVEFTVLGTPAPQGSKTVGRTRDGRSYLREDNPATGPWRQAVTAAALEAAAGRQLNGVPDRMLAGALRLHVVFVFSRPAGHWGTGRNENKLKPSSPLYVRTRPDLDKLLRAVGDAITGIVCRDDAQLVIVHAEKHYGDPACAHISVDELALDDDRAVDEVALSAPGP
jgi:Holliday junction resolvase RusA-like endonuclease